MCVLLGVITEFPARFRFGVERAAPNPATLLGDNPSGWGVAVHAPVRGWTVDGCSIPADREDHRRGVAAHGRGNVLLARVEYRSPMLGSTSPLRRGPWVFVPNGPVDDAGFLATHTSAERRAEVEGGDGSERLFAFLLSAVDLARGSVDEAIRDAASALARHRAVGSGGFLLSDGSALHAFRLGRPMFVVARERGAETNVAHASPETGSHTDVNDLRGRAYFVASETLGREGNGSPLADGDLLRIDHAGIGRRHVR